MATSLLNTEHTYQSLQSFSSIEDLNMNMIIIRETFNKELTPSARRVLDLISSWACKYIGVCYLSKSKMANILEIDIRTVRRSCNQLQKLGIIIQHSTKRACGDHRQSSNAIVIQDFMVAKDENALPECPTVDTLLNTQKINNTDDTKKLISDKEVTKDYLIKNGLVNKLPDTLKHTLAPFFEADLLYSLVGTVYKAKASIDCTVQLDDYEEEYRQSILSVISAFKRGKVKNLSGLLYHAIKSTTKTIWIRQLVCNVYGD